MPELPDIELYLHALRPRVVAKVLNGVRIVFASRETNYCATCQTGGEPLADRALSRLKITKRPPE